MTNNTKVPSSSNFGMPKTKNVNTQQNNGNLNSNTNNNVAKPSENKRNQEVGRKP